MKNAKCKVQNDNGNVKNTSLKFNSTKERRSFIDNYRKWKLIHEAAALNLKFFAVKMSNAAYIVATESIYRDYGEEIKSNVRYCLMLPDNDKFPNSQYYRFYSPGGCGITTVLEYLKFHADIEPIDYECAAASTVSDAESFSDAEAGIIAAMAEANMKVKRAAEISHYTPGGVLYHINKIKKKTGLDMRVFCDLVRLMEMIK